MTSTPRARASAKKPTPTTPRAASKRKAVAKTKAARKPAAKPATPSATKPDSKSAVQSAAKPAAKPAATPATAPEPAPALPTAKPKAAPEPSPILPTAKPASVPEPAPALAPVAEPIAKARKRGLGALSKHALSPVNATLNLVTRPLPQQPLPVSSSRPATALSDDAVHYLRAELTSLLAVLEEPAT